MSSVALKFSSQLPLHFAGDSVFHFVVGVYGDGRRGAPHDSLVDRGGRLVSRRLGDGGRFFLALLFAALSGSSPATVAAIGGISIAGMRQAGYGKDSPPESSATRALWGY